MEISIRAAVQCICSSSSLPSKPPISSLPFPFPFPFPSSSLFRPPAYSHQWRTQLTTTRSLADGNMATEPATSHGSLALKKKATDICSDMKGASIFLVGMKSAMKTSVCKLIADELRYYYFDSDNVVEEAAGEDSSGQSFKERDADGFHKSETEVLKQLSSLGRLVVNAGNGAVQSMTNLALLRHGITIWIDVPLDIIAKESVRDDEQSMTSNLSTPDTISEALDQLTMIYEENRGGYATADATISLQTVATKLAYDEYEQVTAEDMALEVLSQIEKLTRVKKLMEEAGRPF